MEDLIAFLEAPEDGDGVLHRGLIHHDRLEPPLQGGILFDVLPVLVQRGGADAVQLAPGQHGLEKVPGVHAALGLAGAHDGMQLIDEEDDLPLGLAHLLQHGLEPLLKFAPVLGAGDQGAHIQGEDGMILQPVGHIAPDDPLGQPLSDSGLAHAGLTDEDGVVLRLSGEDADDVADLAVPADHRVQLLAPGPGHQVRAVLFQRVIGILRVVGGHRVCLDLAQFLRKTGAGDAVVLEQLLELGAALGKDAQHQMLHGDILVMELFRRALCHGDDLAGLRRGIDFTAAAGDPGQLVDHSLEFRLQSAAVHAHPLEQRAHQAAVLLQQGQQQMLRGQILILSLLGHGLG